MPQTNDTNLEKPSVKIPTWEFLGVIIGYFSSVDDVITLIGHHFFNYCKDNIPHLHRVLISISYAIFLILVSAYFLFKFNTKEKLNNITPEEDFNRILRKIRTIRILRTLGLVILSEWYLDLFKVKTYDYFSRPDEWGEKPGFWNLVMRFRYENKSSVEFQFTKNFTLIQVRQTPQNSTVFGEPVLKSWFQSDHKWLILSSVRGVFWVIIHVLTLGFLRKS